MNERFSADDLRTWLVDVLLLPGDAFVYLLVTYMPPVAKFLDLGTDERGVVTITSAVVVWLAAIILTGTALGKVRDIDRSLTARVAAAFEEVRRLIRVTRRRIIASLALRGQRKRGNDESLIVASLELARLETAVLRCLSAIDDGAVMTNEEIAARLKRPNREIRAALQRLTELDLIRRATDNFVGKHGHCIATAGQMYLLGA
jgi:hypothetical protein